MQPVLHIRLLGTFSLALDSETVPALQSARLQSLLAYLLLNRHISVQRQQLAFLFWPDTTDAQAQTNLRQLLFTLRRRLPDADQFIEITATTVRWRVNAPFDLDVADFQAALAAAWHAAPKDQIACLAHAIDLYLGELAPGCYDDWILPERERLAQQLANALEQLILALEAERSYGPAITYAQRLLRHDPFHEPTYGRLMQMHAAVGDRAAALRVYHTCATLLIRELGVEPSATTSALYETLLDAERVEKPPRQARDEYRLVGRIDAWHTLQRTWSRVLQRRPHFLCVSGEAGIGKTRLVEEMVRWAQLQGIVAVHARAYGAEGELVYAPLAEALRSESLAAPLARLDPVWLTELGRLQPEVLSSRPDLPRPNPATEPASGDRLQRRRLFEALARLFLGERRPVLLVLDDLHWCDGETLEWLHYLLRYDEQAPLMVIGTLRPDEVGPEHPISLALMALRTGQAEYAEVHLERLDRQETAELAAQMVEGPLVATLVERLFQATEGNPLFVVETVHANLPARISELVEDTAAANLPAFQALPPRVRAVLRARLSQPSAGARALVGLAAVVGRSFTVEVLAATGEQDEGTLVRSLDELWQRHIVRLQSASSYDFDHDRLREVAYAELTPVRRRQCHLRVAHALEHVHANEMDIVSAQIAHHYENAGVPERAIVSLQRAASAAQRLYAYSESIGLLEHALSLLAALPPEPRWLERELELQMALCGAWAAISSYLGKEAEVAFHRALTLCRQVQHTPHLFTVLWSLHEVALYRAEYSESIALAQQCLTIAGEVSDIGMLVEAHHALWGPYYFMGEYALALEHMAQGLVLYDREQHEPLSVEHGVHDARACALYEMALIHWQQGHLDQARRALEAGMAHMQELRLPANIADAAGYGGLLYQLLREPARAEPAAELALRISSERGYPYSRFLGAIALGWSLAQQGQVAEGLALATQGMAAGEEAGQQLHHTQFAAMLAECFLLANRPNEAIGVLDEGIARFAYRRDLICAPDLWTLKGDALLALDAPHDEVEPCYHEALSLAHALGARTSELRAAIALARLRLLQDRQVDGIQVLRPAYSWFTEGLDTRDLEERANY